MTTRRTARTEFPTIITADLAQVGWLDSCALMQNNDAAQEVERHGC
ncbi:hypothetical protein [Acidipropionibacterium thoenii]|nr:hypothetical protein [Acidipropionibacterium thoenii]